MNNQSDQDTRSFSRQRQSNIFLGALRGEKPVIPVDYEKLKAKARRNLSKEASAYIEGGAGSESTMNANQRAFDRWRIQARMLRDVSTGDSSISLFGNKLPAPFLLAPIGVLEMAHRDADLAVAKAAASEGIPFIFSSQASVDMETCSDAMGDSTRWFQLYWSESNDLVESFVQRAEKCGCDAIVLTLDTTMLGWRPRDLDLAYLPFLRGKGIAQYTSDPVFRQMMENELDTEESKKITFESIRALISMSRRFPGNFWKNLISGEPLKAVRTFINTYSRPSLTWEDLSFLRELTDLPIILKGIQHPEDAKKAIEAKMDGIIVSNHGGRQVDGAIGSLDALIKIVDEVDGKIPVLLDSGIRTGSHIFKALALGASAVLVGRPYVYTLAIAGESGVREYIQNLRAEFELTMRLAGCRTIDEVKQTELV